MRFKIKEFKRDRFIVVNEREIPVLEDDDKAYVFDDIDDALNLRDKLNARIEEEMAKLS